MISDERRAFKRVKKKFTVKHRPVSHYGAPCGTATSENISMGGVYFISLERFSIGDVLECRISMPGIEEEGRWTARVVRCENENSGMVRTFGVAVEFVEAFGNSERNLRKTLNAS